MNTLNAGQLVRVTSPRSLAYGRVAMVMTVCDGIQVRFADLPQSVAANPNPDGLVQTFSFEELALVEGVPVAAFYLLVTVLTLVGTQEYVRYAIAHGKDNQRTQDVAETVAAMFFGSLGDWDGEFYLRENSPYASKLADFELITVADYIKLSRTTPDYDLGADVSGKPC
ncbi:MAG: hypothetical protein DCF25_11925 [Leptolyngbya foveolarum]|uniref:Uncharacterized protein n=1 Tax=Leptolyngbya foveolarum TaxID=47253 RepID=A0A2W4U6I7_9CYAN|nr:MAG: hypothetical protein DCF25_11925 [Leptolyngbya foveolarum]